MKFRVPLRRYPEAAILSHDRFNKTVRGNCACARFGP
jgi:hypothetical protein